MKTRVFREPHDARLCQRREAEILLGQGHRRASTPRAETDAGLVQGAGPGLSGWLYRALVSALACFLLMGLAGCGKPAIDKGLESDANGYMCLICKAKFYTDRAVFAGHCPQCKQPNVQMVVGQVCPADKHVSIAPRGRGSGLCEQCGKATRGICLPSEQDLKAWGAAKKTAAEVGG